MYLNRNAEIMPENRLRGAAPAIFTEVPYSGTSQKYSFINTFTIVKMLADFNWFPFMAMQNRVIKADYQGFQKHLIAFRNDQIQAEGFPTLILQNAHNGLSSYQFSLGYYRLVCSNGMMVGDTFRNFRINHKGNIHQEVEQAQFEILQDAPKLTAKLDVWKNLEVTQPEQKLLAESLVDFMYSDELEKNPEAPKPRPESFLRPRRYEDKASNLYTTYNVIQENMMKGGQVVTGKNEKGYQVQSTRRKVKAIDSNVKLNKALFSLTEKFAELKLQN